MVDQLEGETSQKAHEVELQQKYTKPSTRYVYVQFEVRNMTPVTIIDNNKLRYLEL